MERITYKGWPNCYRLSNGFVDLIVTTDVGPRIIYFGLSGEWNEFKEYEEMLGLVGGDEWRVYGGHRLWQAPEDPARTYYPDNGPVAIEEHEGAVRLIQPVEPPTGVQKEIDLILSPRSASVTVTHRLRNTNTWVVELAPWALSVMAPGGVAILPLPPRGSHRDYLLPLNTIALWAYTDMSDPRWHWGRQYVMLYQDASATQEQKAGAMVTDGWVAYVREGHLFLKLFDYIEGASYPDLGCSAEVYTDAVMLELETLGPLARLEPGGVAEHVERWFLFRDVPTPENEADIDEYILPKAQAAMAGWGEAP
ncbi:MAG TPA: hypothetical protein ENI95_14885 [Chloroflexi bacterium]|nr:hypothetical protein [Chloroflexota bacterium]